MTALASPDRLAAALAHLAETIDARAAGSDSAKSWTAKLLARGPGACADKVAEEGGEFAHAVRGESEARVSTMGLQYEPQLGQFLGLGPETFRTCQPSGFAED